MICRERCVTFSEFIGRIGVVGKIDIAELIVDIGQRDMIPDILDTLRDVPPALANGLDPPAAASLGTPEGKQRGDLDAPELAFDLPGLCDDDVALLDSQVDPLDDLAVAEAAEQGDHRVDLLGDVIGGNPRHLRE